MSPSLPLDSQRRAFADALGHLVAELVWRDVLGADPENTNGGDQAPRDDDARQLAGDDADAVEVDDASMCHNAA